METKIDQAQGQARKKFTTVERGVWRHTWGHHRGDIYRKYCQDLKDEVTDSLAELEGV